MINEVKHDLTYWLPLKSNDVILCNQTWAEIHAFTSALDRGMQSSMTGTLAEASVRFSVSEQAHLSLVNFLFGN